MFRKGFTLAELIVVMSIIIIISTVSVVVFQAQRKKQTVGVDAENIKNIIMQAHSMAMNRDEADVNVKYIQLSFWNNNSTPPYNMEIEIKKILTSGAQVSVPGAKLLYRQSDLNLISGNDFQPYPNPLCTINCPGFNIRFNVGDSAYGVGEVANFQTSNPVGKFMLTRNLMTGNDRYEMSIDRLSGNVIIKSIP
jgi:prepilin-type N-terminal cleavage/methylation domain-containing protein